MNGAPRIHRLAFTATYASLLAALWMGSPLGPATPALGGLPAGVVAWFALAILTLPVTLPDRPPLPGLLGIAVTLLLVNAYDASHLDWSRLLKDWGLTRHGPVAFTDLLVAGATIATAVAWSLHDQAHRLRAHYTRKGVPATQVDAAVHRVRRAGTGLLVRGVVAFAVAAVTFRLARPAIETLQVADPLLTPLLAGGLLLAAAYLALRGRREPDAGA